MKKWQKVWLEGVLQQFNEESKQRLKQALQNNDCSVIQEHTATDKLGHFNADAEAQCCCPIAHAVWKPGMRIKDVESAFYRICHTVDNALLTKYEDGDDFVTTDDFVNWWDETLREDAVRELLELM